jgi:hypothetical protein
MMNFSLLNDSQGQEIEFLRLNYYCNYSKFDHYVTFLNFGVGISAILSLLVYCIIDKRSLSTWNSIARKRRR